MTPILTPQIERPSSLEQLSTCRRFFVFGLGDIARALHLILAARFPVSFFGFFSHDAAYRDERTGFRVRPLRDHIDDLKEGDYLFLCIRDQGLEKKLTERGVRLGYPDNLFHNYSTYEIPVFERFLNDYFSPKSPVGLGIDIGANMGMTATMMSRYFDNVIAAEPNRQLFANLQTLAGLPNNVRLLDIAFGAEDGTTTFFELSGGANGTLDATEDATSYTVTVTTLDSYCRSNDLAPSFIKIDAEGADGDIILSATEVIETHRPILFFENPAAAPHNPEKWRHVQNTLEQSYHLKAYQCLNKIFHPDDIGADLSDFTTRSNLAPLNIAAIPK